MLARRLADNVRLRVALVICLCFLLTSTGWLSWLYRVMDYASPASVDILTMGCGYFVQAVGIAAFMASEWGRTPSHARRMAVASLVLYPICLVPATLAQGLEAVLAFGYLANVFCGINEGYNIASSIQYSGTCGAAFEAANQGCHTIAFSEYHEGPHDVADKYIEEITSVLIDKPLGVNEIWNINFPGCTLEACKGIKYDCSVSQRPFFSGRYKEVKSEGAKRTYMFDYVPSWDAEEGTDLRAVIDNYVAVGKVRNYS